jgi:1-acyl-sn-glycerol-3-phosphate acyltransferase
MGEGWYRTTIAVGRVALRALDLTVRREGTEHLPTSGPALLAANHASFPDFALIGEAALSRGRLVRFLSRHDVWHAPVVGRAMTGMGHVPVDREAPAAAYLHARRHLRAGEAVCLFPEAGVSFSYTVRALMPGAAALARETGLPIIPVAVWGPQRLWPVGHRPDGAKRLPHVARGRLVDVVFGEPVPAGDDVVATTRVLGERLTAMLEAVQRRPEHRPRPGEVAPWYPRHLGGHAPTRAEAALVEKVPRHAIAPTWGPTDDGRQRPAGSGSRSA